jgi:hypothetical protein
MGNGTIFNQVGYNATLPAYCRILQVEKSAFDGVFMIGICVIAVLYRAKKLIRLQPSVKKHSVIAA